MKKCFSILMMTISAAIIFSGCGKSRAKTIQVPVQETNPTHTWYYFSDGNYRKIEKPSLVPETLFKPWTEAVRISDASCQSGTGTGFSSSEYSTPEGFAIVNRTGVLVFNDSEIKLCRDVEFFRDSTAGNLVFFNNTPVFSVFKSSFFNDKKNSNSVLHPFLIQFNPEQNICYPVINMENLGLSEKSEITDYVWDGQYWTCSIKETGSEKINFSYITFQPKEPVSSISPATASDLLFIREASMDSFRNIRTPESFNQAPRRVKALLGSLPPGLAYTVTVYTASGHSPRNFVHGAVPTEETPLKATVLISDTWIASLFTDGTLFMNGALYDRHILRENKNIGIRLPKLPSGFVYGSFTISGTKLYAAWEETSFYTTARSGFICVDLNEILYKNTTR